MVSIWYPRLTEEAERYEALEGRGLHEESYGIRVKENVWIVIKLRNKGQNSKSHVPLEDWRADLRAKASEKST